MIVLLGPRCIPILGNIQILFQLKNVKFYHLLWNNLSKIYGPLVGLKFFNTKIVIVSGQQMVKRLCNKEELNGRPDGFFFRIRSFNKRLGVVFTDGKIWEEQRLFCVKTLKTLGFGKSSMIEHIEFEAEELVNHLSNNGCEFDIQDKENNIFDIPVMNVMWKILRGERFKLDDPKVIKLMSSIHKCFQIIDMSGGVLNNLPILRYLFPVASGYRPLINAMQPLWDFLSDNIHEVSENYDCKQKPQNFIEYYCREIKIQTNSASFFSYEQLLALCVDFFQAGSETTSNTISFAMLYMLHYPEVMKKVQNELHHCVGDRLPKLIDRTNLKYSEAVICEVSRLANVAALGIAHRAEKCFRVDKFVIPKDSIILFNIYSLHMDENYWKDPLEFRPERFLENGAFVHHENFSPFGNVEICFFSKFINLTVFKRFRKTSLHR
jgi:methyl farnesoate epoxidase / farnesoate epoxidase